jgi:hypothetical protein
VVVDEFDFVRIAIAPDEADPLLIVDANRVLTPPISR